MDTNTQPTVAPTADPASVTPSGGTLAVPVVNPAQAPTTLSSSQQNPVDVSGLIANYEGRIRTLMSEKDKAINERNVAISAQTEMQKSLTDLQAQSSTSLSQAATAAQTAIDENKQLRARVSVLEGELLRMKTLLEHPDLAPYADFIPATGDEAKQREAIEKLKAIREQDLARARNPYGVPQPTGAQGQPAQSGVPAQSPDLYGLYGNRPNIPPSLIGSNPAQMHPAGGQSTVDSIAAMLKEARESGDPARFEEALRQSTVLARQAVDTQLGRTATS